jgi:hypothetical protein
MPPTITVPTIKPEELTEAASRLGARAKQAFLDGEPELAGNLAVHAGVLAKQAGDTASATAFGKLADALLADAFDPAPKPSQALPPPPPAT